MAGERCPDLDVLTWRHRNEAHEALILQLNGQVEALTRELSEVQSRAVDRSELAAAQAAAAEAEARAVAMGQEREGVAAEVEAMQAALAELQREASAEAGARARMGRLKASLEDARTQVHSWRWLDGCWLGVQAGDWLLPLVGAGTACTDGSPP